MALEILILEYDSDDVAEAGTTTTNIKMIGHNLNVGDFVINSTRNSIPPAFDNIASRRVLAVPDIDNITVLAIPDQTTGDTIKKFIHKDRINLLRPKTLHILRQSENDHTCSLTLISTLSYKPRAGQNLIIKNNGSLIFGGIINEIKSRKIQGSVKIVYKLFSNGYSDIPAKRTVTNVHSDTDSGTLVEFYIDNYLYQEGISKGTIDTGATIIRKDAVCVSIKNILDDLKDASGFKCYIDDSMTLHFLQDDAVVNAAHDLDMDTFTSFWDVEFTETLNNYRNKQFIRGTAGSDGYVVQVSSTNADEVTSRQNIEGNSGYYGRVLDNSSIDNATDAEIASDNLIKKYGKTLPNTIRYNTMYTDFEPNTKLRVDLPEYGIDESYFLIETVEISDINGKAIKSVIQGVQRDTSDFSTQKSEDFTDFFGKIVSKVKQGSGSNFVSDDEGNLYQVQIYVQEEEPPAKGKTFWLKPSDYSSYDKIEIAADETLEASGGKYVKVTGTTTVTLFAVSGNTGVVRYIVNAGTGLVTIDGNASETIGGALTLLLYPGEGVLIICDGTGWDVF